MDSSGIAVNPLTTDTGNLFFRNYSSIYQSIQDWLLIRNWLLLKTLKSNRWHNLFASKELLEISSCCKANKLKLNLRREHGFLMRSLKEDTPAMKLVVYLILFRYAFLKGLIMGTCAFRKQS